MPTTGWNEDDAAGAASVVAETPRMPLFQSAGTPLTVAAVLGATSPPRRRTDHQSVDKLNHEGKQPIRN